MRVTCSQIDFSQAFLNVLSPPPTPLCEKMMIRGIFFYQQRNPRKSAFPLNYAWKLNNYISIFPYFLLLMKYSWACSTHRETPHTLMRKDFHLVREVILETSSLPFPKTPRAPHHFSSFSITFQIKYKPWASVYSAGWHHLAFWCLISVTGWCERTYGFSQVKTWYFSAHLSFYLCIPRWLSEYHLEGSPK